MKLPTNKKERTQIFVMIGIAVAGAIYAIITFVVKPLMASRQDIPKKIEAIQGKIQVAQTAVNTLPDMLEQYNTMAETIQATVSQYLLDPVLGSYILRAEQLLKEQAQAVNVEIDGLREVGIRDLPKPPRRKDGFRLRSYTVNVTLKTDYETTMRFIDAIERSNPFVSVLAMNLVEQPGNPTVHDVRFDVQWPIWAGIDELPRVRTE